jgi:hypothetical protein
VVTDGTEALSKRRRALCLVWVDVAREGSWERTTTLKIRKNFWVLNNDHQSEDEEGDHEERAVVIIFACCHDYHKANGLKNSGECWEITSFKVTNIHFTSAYSSSVTCFDSLNHHQAKYKTQYWFIQ